MKSIILLSGGLDSLVSCGIKKNDIELAITFDYGQKSVRKEINASKKICNYYGIKHKVIKLDLLKEITSTALVSDDDVPCVNLDDEETCKNSAKSVWVPNRNGLFLNIAAAYCDSFGYKEIIIGANAEEAKTFPDNTSEFIARINKTFEYSTLVKPIIVAPLINFDKNGIVKTAKENNIPLTLVQSCYNSDDGHCGQCESCKRLKRALAENECFDLIKEIFGNDEN